MCRNVQKILSFKVFCWSLVVQESDVECPLSYVFSCSLREILMSEREGENGRETEYKGGRDGEQRERERG